MGRKYLKVTLALLLIVIVALIIHLGSQHRTVTVIWPPTTGPVIDDADASALTFTDENSDNVTGFAAPVVPDVIHYVVLDNPFMDFNHYLSVRSALKYHKPKQIVIHCNCNQLKGKYWSQLMADSSANRTIAIRQVVKPENIFGTTLSSIYHVSDVVRIEIMKTFGGIYLDNDVFVVKSLDQFRKFEFTIGWPLKGFIGNQVLIGHRNARFPHLWYESYHKYRPDRWYYNAGEYPTKELLEKKPSLVHRVTNEFGVHNLVPMLYEEQYPLWRERFFTIHLLSRHKSYLVPTDPIVYFDESNVKTYNKTFGQMARLVLYDTTDLIDH